MESEDPKCQHPIPGHPNPGADEVLQPESEQMNGSTLADRVVSKIQEYAINDKKNV